MNKVEVVADFLCNGLEHASTDEAVEYLVKEANLDSSIARRLVDDFLAKYSATPMIPNAVLFPFLEKYL